MLSFKKENFKKILIVLDIANNHNGSVIKGLEIINKFHEIIKNFNQFDFIFKFQYRDLPEFIHPNYRNNFEYKYIKRFTETYLTSNQYKMILFKIKELGYLSACTPFSENAVDEIINHNFDIIKIASCSITDWPLLEKISKTKLPIIASTAGASIEDIQKVYSFLKNRNKDFAIDHCVAEYPTLNEHLELNQIDFLKEKFPDIEIGYSTHENPTEIFSPQICISKDVKIFERHIDLDCETINKYSSTPEQINNWLWSIVYAIEICGVKNKRYEISEKEHNDLQGLKRGVFLNKDLKEGEEIKSEDIFYAIPNFENQLLAEDISKYRKYFLTKYLNRNEAVFFKDVKVVDIRDRILKIVNDIKQMILKSGLAIPEQVEMEISHQYGLDKFYECGCVLFNIINRDYGKKILIVLPNQKHPCHFHVKKEECFSVLHGTLELSLIDKKKKDYIITAGNDVVVEREVPHFFTSKDGCIFEEISTKYYTDDSFYEDQSIMNNKDRKTKITFLKRWLYEEIS